MTTTALVKRGGERGWGVGHIEPEWPANLTRAHWEDEPQHGGGRRGVSSGKIGVVSHLQRAENMGACSAPCGKPLPLAQRWNYMVSTRRARMGRQTNAPTRGHAHALETREGIGPALMRGWRQGAGGRLPWWVRWTPAGRTGRRIWRAHERAAVWPLVSIPPRL
jgi:hypothetical protein